MDAKRNNKKMHRSHVDVKPFVPDVQGCREPPRLTATAETTWPLARWYPDLSQVEKTGWVFHVSNVFS